MSAPVEVQADSIPSSAPRSLTLELISRGINAVWQVPAGSLGARDLLLYGPT